MIKSITGFLLLLVFAGNGANAQPADTSYHVLWYSGKKIKANILVTKTGDTVQYNPEKGVVKVISKAGSGKQFDNMLRELDRTPQRLQEMIGKLQANLPKTVLPAYGSAVSGAYEDVKKNYAAALSNTVTLPANTALYSTQASGKGAFLKNEEEDPFDEAIKEFRSFIAGHSADKITSVPVPPKRELDYCYPCDGGKDSEYKKQMEAFLEALRGDDNAILNKALNVSREASLRLSTERNIFIQKEVVLLIEFVFGRMRQRVELLIEKYIDDPERCSAVLNVALSTDRQHQLTGLGDPLPQGYLMRAWMSFANKLEQAIREEDYTIVLNLQLILSTERQFQLSGATMPNDLFKKAIHFNQFKMNVNVSAKIISNGTHLLAQVKGDNWYHAVPDSNCRLHWILVGPETNKISVDLLAAELKGGSSQISYVGTKKWNSFPPTMKADFCHVDDKPDSIIAYTFFPEGHKELWQMPHPMGIMNVAQVNIVLTGCFIDVDRVKADAVKYKNPENVEKLKKEMMEQYNQMMKNYKQGSIGDYKKMDVSKLSAIATAQQNGNAISELMQSPAPGKYIFLPAMHNKAKVAVLEKLNGKEIFPQNTATEYAWYHLTIEHDPEGPYHIF